MRLVRGFKRKIGPASAVSALALLAACGCHRATEDAAPSGRPAGDTMVRLHTSAAPAPQALPPMNDPGAILRRMVAAYKDVQTMQVATEGDQRITGPAT